MKIPLFLILFITSGIAYSQDITVYKDTLNGFNVFDAGPQKKIESLPVKTFKIGQSIIAYEDFQSHLKIYYKGIVYKMCDSVKEYAVSKCFAVGLSNGLLKVFDNCKMKILTAKVGNFACADSLVAFHDNSNKGLKIYYKGRSKQLEDTLVGHEVTNLKAGGNVLAYIDYKHEFKLCYHGKVTTLCTLSDTLPMQYEVGQDVVAYIKNDDHSFNVHWWGKNYKIEDSGPESFVAGNNFVAYVDSKGVFKIFTEGHVTVISKIKPGIYKIADNIIAYSENNEFKAYYKGTSHLLEKYIPKKYQCDDGTIAYTDMKGAMILFMNGKKETVTTDVITDFSLNGSLLKYSIGNKTWIYYKGNTY